MRFCHPRGCGFKSLFLADICRTVGGQRQRIIISAAASEFIFA